MKRIVIWLIAAASLVAAAPNRLPNHLPPEIYAWFWSEKEFQPEGYRAFVDLVAANSNFNFLTTSLRAPTHEVAFPETHDQIKRGVEYARSRGFRVAFDLDVRLARGTFLKRYPGQQQWMLRVRAFPASPARAGTLAIESQRLDDHMTGGGGEYELLRGRLLRAYRVAGGALESVPLRATVESPGKVAVEVPSAWQQSELIVAAAFEYRTPDVFAPALLEFQTSIYEQYRDVPLDGALKDEWGFPPVYGMGPRQGDFWYSDAFERAYREAGGEDLVRDAVLMFRGAGGTRAQRIAAVNRYERLILERNVRIERDFYAQVKRIWGPDAFAGTHATWGIMPSGDAFKNGYDWWQATRDYGQTDEAWAYPVRTSLAKKMGKPVWFNQYYNTDAASYAPEVWRAAREGGRLNFHQLYPSPPPDYHLVLFRSPAIQAQTRIRLLNYISRAPIDSPVAVVFGHTAALNWLEPAFGDLGIDFAEALGREGFRADVIPSSEIESGALAVKDGMLAYGAQRYRAMVFLNLAHEPPRTVEFLREVARSNTLAFLRGAAPGAPIEGVYSAPDPGRVAWFLRGSYTAHPLQPADLSRLADGTCLLARGEHNPAGDPIDETFYCGNVRVKARATGVFAVRFSGHGELLSLAASGLKSLDAGSVHLDLAEPVDVAIWHNAQGEAEGVIQGLSDNVPKPLEPLARRWSRLPPAPQEQEKNHAR